jgi:lactoylglutathione lyase
MHIEHIAIWTNHLEEMRDFYEAYFQAESGKKYHNPAQKFESYFLCFSSGPRLELMSMPDILESPAHTWQQFTGYIHLSIATGAMEQVDALTERLRRDGFQVMEDPRHTGDGYYESVVLDPDGNRIELTV